MKTIHNPFGKGIIVKLQENAESLIYSVRDCPNNIKFQILYEIDVIAERIKDSFNPFYDSEVHIHLYEGDKPLEESGLLLVEFAQDERDYIAKLIKESFGNTLVVNLFAGPGGGKTTCAWDIASKLKQRGVEAEYVSEYAKELVWDGKTEMLDGSAENQKKIYEEQSRKVQRLLGKVDVVVTDSPAILSAIYSKDADEDFVNRMLFDFSIQRNFNLFINRGKTFQQQGRIHTLEQSKEIDRQIKEFLSDNKIYCGNYYHKTLDVVVDNIIKTLGGK